MKRLLLYAAGLAALAALTAALLLGRSSSPSLDDQTHAVASRLRCPTCVAESADDSTSPVAAGMRAEIHRQLAAGRSEDQVVGWFRARYGPDIVLVPDRHGLGWVLWVAPPVALAVGALAFVAVQRRRPSQATRAGPLPAGRLAVALAAVVAVGVGVPLLVTGSRHHTGSAASSPTSAAATSADPVDTAFQLLKGGHPKEAESLVAPIATRPGRDRALALLVLGLAQRADSDPAARRTLSDFVHLYPHHPATPEVRRLLKGA